jgi:ABC-2 type transport system permease protein
MFPTVAIATRTLRQLVRSKRFLALSLVAPIVIVYFFKLFFDAQSNSGPLKDRFALPIAALLVHFLAFILSVIAVTSDRTRGTLERVLIVGYRKRQIIYGYTLAYGGLGILQTLIALITTKYFLQLNYPIDFFMKIGAAMLLLAVISVALGIFISTFARNEAEVLPFIPLILLPSVFISGMLIDFDKLPMWAQWVGHALPLHYAVDFIQHVVAGQGALRGDVLALLALLLGLLLIAPLTIRERG